MIDFLSTRVDFSFAINKLERFSSNTEKLHFEGLEHLLRYIKDNNTLLLKYYSETKDASLSDLLRHASINTDNKLMGFSDYSCKYFPDTVRGTFSLGLSGYTNMPEWPSICSLRL